MQKLPIKKTSSVAILILMVIGGMGISEITWGETSVKNSINASSNTGGNKCKGDDCEFKTGEAKSSARVRVKTGDDKSQIKVDAHANANGKEANAHYDSSENPKDSNVNAGEDSSGEVNISIESDDQPIKNQSQNTDVDNNTFKNNSKDAYFTLDSFWARISSAYKKFNEYMHSLIS